MANQITVESASGRRVTQGDAGDSCGAVACTKPLRNRRRPPKKVAQEDRTKRQEKGCTRASCAREGNSSGASGPGGFRIGHVRLRRRNGKGDE